MSSNDKILCGCGKPAVCAHVKSAVDLAILSCEEHEHDYTAVHSLSNGGWRKITIREYEVLTIMDS